MLHKYIENKKIKREYIGKIKSWSTKIPSLIEIQLKSYEDFLQRKRLMQDLPLEMKGLHEVFKSIFPIVSEQNDVLDYNGYILDEKGIRYKEKECKKKGASYTIPAKASITLMDDTTGEIKQKDIYIGDIPLMTERGTFIINGSERVVVSQIHRSPGVAFVKDKGVLMARLIPYRGSWLEFEIDKKKKVINAKIDRKKKVLATVFLKALGVEDSNDIIKLFYDVKTVSVSNLLKSFKKDSSNNYILAKTIVGENGNVLRRISTPIYQYDLEEFIKLGIKEIEVVKFDSSNSVENELILNCLLTEEKHLKEGQEELTRVDIMHILYSTANFGDVANLKNSEEDFRGIFFDEKRYSLGKVGRYKINKRFKYEDDRKSLILEERDIVNTLKYLIDIYSGKKDLDDIDHLGNRRVRSVGELLCNQIKVALIRIERVAREKMNAKNLDRSSLRPQDLISIKPVIGAIKEFFTSSQLSQFMDQINPLAELTHKRRLNALGPGGLARDRAGFEVRDIHYTHYGRICPIETPEGPNIGLIVSLASYAKINEYGFIETPYRKVKDSVVSKDVKYLSAIDEDGYLIAQADAKIDDEGRFLERQISSRKSGDYLAGNPKDIEYMDLSSRQIISISTALIPFLEHDDASRALMGSNMQRQAVPLLFAEPPRVGTGIESMISDNSGVIVKAEEDGVVVYVSNSRIDIKNKDGEVRSYPLLKYQKTNQESCFNQKPIVNLNEEIEAGQIIADGPSTFHGELSLGKNVLAGFIPWNGYGFEDAVLISERISKDDVFTSIHIKELSVDVRDTKLGREYISRDIPNVSEKMLSHLDENGIIRIGSYVSTGSILVGKVSPKSETENSPEFKLLNQIFGEKAKNIKDSSLRVPHGVEGIVIDVQILKRKDGDELQSTVEESVKVFIASKHKLREGDKIAGRHGNKGVISRVLPEEDMPFLEDGTPLDICFNPLGVPSRMNIGQILESELGISAMALNKFYESPVFSSASIKQIENELEKSGFPKDCKFNLRDGRTGEMFKNPVFVGCMYVIKLNHLVDHKMHARSTGPYSLITQQPLGGKAQFGGQRLGEMEVWALEAYGAAHTLQEFLTIKSDNIEGRTKIYEDIIKGYESATVSGVPESFNVLVQELRGLGIDLTIYSSNNKQIPLTQKDRELLIKEEEEF